MSLRFGLQETNLFWRNLILLLLCLTFWIHSVIVWYKIAPGYQQGVVTLGLSSLCRQDVFCRQDHRPVASVHSVKAFPKHDNKQGRLFLGAFLCFSLMIDSEEWKEETWRKRKGKRKGQIQTRKIAVIHLKPTRPQSCPKGTYCILYFGQFCHIMKASLKLQYPFFGLTATAGPALKHWLTDRLTL